jgi:hypothetical protein
MGRQVSLTAHTDPLILKRSVLTSGTTPELMQAWLAAAESALNYNRSSFATLPIVEFLGPDGWLAKLRAMGYSVEEPS